MLAIVVFAVVAAVQVECAPSQLWPAAQKPSSFAPTKKPIFGAKEAPSKVDSALANQQAYEQFINTWLQQASLTLNRPDLLKFLKPIAPAAAAPTPAPAPAPAIGQSVVPSLAEPKVAVALEEVVPLVAAGEAPAEPSLSPADAFAEAQDVAAPAEDLPFFQDALVAGEAEVGPVELSPVPVLPEVLAGTPEPEVVPVAAEAEVVPVAAEVEVVPVAAEVEVVPVAAEAEVVPVAAEAEVVPVAAEAEVVPVAAEAEVVPVAAEAEVVPVAAEAEVLPVAAEAEVVPVIEFIPVAAEAETQGIPVEAEPSPVAVEAEVVLEPLVAAEALPSLAELDDSAVLLATEAPLPLFPLVPESVAEEPRQESAPTARSFSSVNRALEVSPAEEPTAVAQPASAVHQAAPVTHPAFPGAVFFPSVVKPVRLAPMPASSGAVTTQGLTYTLQFFPTQDRSHYFVSTRLGS
ncbi:calphotin-like [Penaeus chinensis]|uniref:calphotin-like n=1 Tax=Penaeus chinensis TaxID=139456 RepID=UPI001FB7BECE|nr:calphotin-like [Penaeus chinensis]